MKKTAVMIVCLLAMMAASTGLNAQEISVLIRPGWNWIGYPYPETVDLGTAFGDFEPLAGDVIESCFEYSEYLSGYGWYGGVSELRPGWGYMYYSNRTEAVSIVLHVPASQTAVTTAMPTDITTTSAVAGGMVILPEGSHVFLRGVCWGTAPGLDIDGDHTREETGIGSFSSTLEGLSPNTTYYVRAYVVSDHGLAYGNEVNFITVAEGGIHGYVDLGLPSGLLWATCNVGANAPEEYGDYFAWGETQPKDTYNWSIYQHCMGNVYMLTRYCDSSSFGYNGFTDNLTTLLPEDDAATTNWGSVWRMPTKEEWQELYNNTTCIWTTQDGVNGQLFTASNGNSLFLPAAGCRDDHSLDGAGSFGSYWSNLLGMDYPLHAWAFSFYSGDYDVLEYSRHYGRSVRAVRPLGQNTSFFINVTANPTESGIVTGSGIYQEGQSCTVTATANEGYTFSNWTENGAVVSINATYSFTVEADRTLVANFAVPSGESHEYVDLGLPSGLLWATCNVGAYNPEDYGDYFAWGETQPKDTYDWSTYLYCNGGDGWWNTMNKYCNDASYGYNGYIDDLTTLLPEDDVATANWGGDWRMPTKEEWQELYQNTTHSWTTQYGVNGRLFTAANGNSLFLPATGRHSGSNLFYDGSYGYYWSSSLNMDNPCDAWTFYLGSDNYYNASCYRLYGQSIRAVRSGTQNNTPTGAINGKFTITEEGDQVYFSQGNLQYIGSASTPYWKFADNQWDVLGTTTGQNSIDLNVDRDFFGWGTSGWNNGNVYYQPFDTQDNGNYSQGYGYGPTDGTSYTYNLTGTYANADWGIYNPMSNGGNQANQWRTLTHPEWAYIFNTRTTSSGIRYAKANVNNVNGVILLPDDWSSDTYSLSNTNSSGASYNSNAITASQWSALEQAGAVFLPAAGDRYGTSVSSVGSSGNYWSASCNGSLGAGGVYFNVSYISTDDNYYRGSGFSVRLARVAE